MPSGTKLFIFGAVTLSLWGLHAKSHAAVRDQLMQNCILDTFLISRAERSVQSIHDSCHHKLGRPIRSNSPPSKVTRKAATSHVIKPTTELFSLAAHRLNYFLPISQTSEINRAAYTEIEDWPQDLKNMESKYQLSIRTPVGHDIWRTGDSINMAFTITAWWQTYTKNLSRPFRETNYRPEVFYTTPVKTPLWGFAPEISIGLEHHSNGRDTPLSRGWNRVFTELRLTKPDKSLYLRPWYRLRDSNGNQSQQNINSDIDNYFGYFETGGNIQYHGKYQLSYMLRGNPKTERGATEWGFSFPLRGRLRGYSSIFHGYGESLIDYNHSQTRIGLGFSLTTL